MAKVGSDIPGFGEVYSVISDLLDIKFCMAVNIGISDPPLHFLPPNKSWGLPGGIDVSSLVGVALGYWTAAVMT